MKSHFKILSVYGILLPMLAGTALFASQPAWTVLVFMQADNSLAQEAAYNIKDAAAGMCAIGSTGDVNVVVEMQYSGKQPGAGPATTTRYKVLKGSLQQQGTTLTGNDEIGANPKEALISSVSWLRSAFPAQNYLIVLWDHGNGVLDRSGKKFFNMHSWLCPAGLGFEGRGILYEQDPKDKYNNSYLATADMNDAFAQIRSILGAGQTKAPTIMLGMDACLMNMIEVATEVQASVDYIIGSEETIPGPGWPYAAALGWLAQNPQAAPAKFAAQIVSAYSNFYADNQNPMSDPTYTLAALDMSKISAACSALQKVAQGFTTLASLGATGKNLARSIVRSAQRSAKNFTIQSYLDMTSLLSNLANGVGRARVPTGLKAIKKQMAVLGGSTTGNGLIAQAIMATQGAIIAHAAGSQSNGASGMSVYFPAAGSIDKGYQQTSFARTQEGQAWITLLSQVGGLPL